MSLRCHGLTVVYDEGGRAIPALTDVGFAVAAGTSVALLGATGAGKSTLLQALRGLLEPEAGAVELDGLATTDAGFADRRREVGLVFQRPELQLFAGSAREDVAFGPRRLGWPAEAVATAVEAALELVGLPPAEFGERHPYALSGGEQRRLALAGVLAMRPRLLLLDEPFVSLDPAARRTLAAVLRRLVEGGTTLLLATHDVDAAWGLCDERLVLDEGRLVAAGPWAFGDGGEQALAGHGLEPPFLIELWRRLGRPAGDTPRTYAAAAEALR
jgi:energy-coupling factor transport system ATP-binding protein